MINALILQVDNRTELDYLGLTKWVNGNRCKYMNESSHIKDVNYHYSFVLMEPKYYERLHPATAKILCVNDILKETPHDFIIFLDSDAWIQTPEHLHELILLLHNDSSKHGSYSRDPYVSYNTYINSGSFILKVNDYVKNMYEEIIKNLQEDPSHHYEMYYDQNYISPKIYERRNDFIIFKPDVLNTPFGKILRHNWWKNQKMYADLYDILDIYRPYLIPKPFCFETEYDEEVFPNPNEHGNEYRC